MADKKTDTAQDTAAFGGAAVGAQSSAAEAAAADAMREGMGQFREVAERLLKVGAEQKKGNLFEYIEAAKFNADAAHKGVGVRAVVTAAERRPHDPVDIELRRGTEVLKSVQAKASKSTTSETWRLSDPKYDGMDKLVPRDHTEVVRNKAEQLAERGTSKVASPESLRDTARNVTGELKTGEVTSGGTTLSETYKATHNPKLYVLQKELQVVGREALVSGASAAAAGAVMGGAISTIKNTYSVMQGTLDGKTAAKKVVTDTAKSGARGGGAGAVSAVIRHGANKAGVQALTKSNVATAMAAGLIEAGVTVYDYAKGEIPIELAAERLGQTGCSTLSGVYVGAAAGAIFGPAGALMGSMAGYILAATVYQSCIAVFKEAQLAEAEADRVVALCEEAMRVIDAQRLQFEAELDAFLQDRQASFDTLFETIDNALVGETPDIAVRALSDLASLCGQELQFEQFEDFDRFMLESDAPMVF
jgi:hypothetical protein